MIFRNISEVLNEINNLDCKKVGSYKNTPTEILKGTSEISCEHLAYIWYEKVIEVGILTLLNINITPVVITPIFKNEDSTLAEKL